MQNADDLIAEVGSRHGFDGELCRSLRLSRDGRMGDGADGLALEAAVRRFAADQSARLKQGVLSLWHRDKT